MINSECALMEEYVYGISKKISWNDIGMSLKYLIDALHIIYDKKVVLLVDEYDRNLTTLFEENSQFYGDTLNLFKFLLDPIKKIEKLLFAVFTGATKMAKAGIFTGFNNFFHDSVIDSGFSEFFDFTEAEVDSLLNKLIELKPELSKNEVKDLITKWYNGYWIGNETIYNPWSIMNCFFKLHKGLVNPYRKYWIDVGSTKLIEDAVIQVPTINQIEELIINGQTEFSDVESFTFEEIKTDERALFSLLLHSGYITKFKDDFYKIPNYEVYSNFFIKLLPLWLKRRFPDINIKSLINEFENTEAYGNVFHKEFLDRLIFGDYKEKYFQLLATLQFDILSPGKAKHKKYNKQQSIKDKRIDILLNPIKEE